MTDSAPTTINSVSHAIRLLALLQDGHPLGLVDLSTRLNLPRATVSRLLSTLMAHDLLIRDNKKYRLSLRLLEIAAGATAAPALQDAVYPSLAKLVQETDMTAHYAVLDGLRAGYIAVLDAPGTPHRSAHVGWRAPLSTTAVGKVMLAFSAPEVLEAVIQGGLPKSSPQSIVDEAVLRREIVQVQTQGYAVDEAEMFTGLYCVAVPVQSQAHLLGALAISGQQRPENAKVLHRWVRQVTQEAEQISFRIRRGRAG